MHLTEPLRIALVDDEPGVLAALHRLLRQGLHDPARPLHIACHTDPRRALAQHAERPLDLIVSDYRMPGIDGVALLARFARSHPDAARLLLTGSPDLDAVLRAVNDAGAARVLLKPWDPAALLATLRDCLRDAAERRRARVLATQALAARGELDPQESERRRLEAQWPGITDVQWTADGAVQFGDTGLAPLDTR
ncbi:MAG: response regulator [Burkholderiaceae bacterium]